MKKLLALLVAATATFAAVPTAEARPFGHGNAVFVSHYLPCGTPVYAQRVFAGYDRCGNPVFQVRALPVRRSFGVHRPGGFNPCAPGWGHRRGGFHQSAVRIGGVTITRSNFGHCR